MQGVAAMPLKLSRTLPPIEWEDDQRRRQGRGVRRRCTTELDVAGCGVASDPRAGRVGGVHRGVLLADRVHCP